jgi:CRP-like cAMP-binding protein
MQDQEQQAEGRLVEPATQPPGSSVRADAFLITAGLVVASVSPDRTPRTAVGLLGPWTLVGPDLDEARQSGLTSYHALLPTTVIPMTRVLFRQAMHQNPALQPAYAAQLQERLSQMALVAACNAQHSLAERCARWLLRLRGMLGDVIPVTHSFLAMVLGVRRAGISVALEVLQHGGAVTQHRGRIIVIDAEGLAARACSCPNGLTATQHPISVDMVSGNLSVGGGPRMWLESEIRNRPTAGDDAWTRREAALRVCRAILAQGQILLAR